MFWFKSRKGRLFESTAIAIEAAIKFGLVSGAAVSAAFGQFILSGILAVLAAGIFLRFKRGRLRRKKN